MHYGELTTRDAEDGVHTDVLEPMEKILPYKDLRHFDVCVKSELVEEEKVDAMEKEDCDLGSVPIYLYSVC